MDPPDGAERRPGFPALGMKRSKARLTKTVGLSGPRASAIRIALPVAAAGLLGKSRLDWQVSLSGTLHLWNRSASIAPCAKSSTIVSSRLSSLYSSAAMPFTPLRTGLSVTRPSLSRRFRITFRCYAISSPGYHIRTTSTCPANNPPPADHWLITPLLGKGPAADDGCVPPQPAQKDPDLEALGPSPRRRACPLPKPARAGRQDRPQSGPRVRRLMCPARPARPRDC